MSEVQSVQCISRTVDFRPYFLIGECTHSRPKDSHNVPKRQDFNENEDGWLKVHYRL